MGEHSLLVDCPDLASVLTLRDALRTDPLPGQVEVVAAAATVLVRFVSPPAAAAATTLLGSQVRHRAVPPEGSSPSTATVGLPAPAGVARARRTAPTTIEVVYDGPDLAEVAGLRGLSVEAVVAEHTDQTWTGAFGGFAPGFVYLTGRGADVPRRSTPRTVVPAGAVGVAGGFSAVYPTRSPGGWHLIGLAQAVMWDPDRDPAALVAPGGSVRFVAVRPRVVAGSSALDRPTAAPRADPPATPTVTEGSSWVGVVEPGPLSLVED
ncbi:MAG: carboxyltransferase domain-containing protein, partial [Cellulomonadaceae bacterium]|nr:carboxyltransferase domain-containing protein [Cellulomonadaceae bacterium]